MKRCIVLLTLMVMIFAVSSVVGVADRNIEGGENMSNIQVTHVPAEYRRAVSRELKGSLKEVSYPVTNYINESRQLVTDQGISSEEAGRETVQGEAIAKKCNIYLPPGYDVENTDTKYNVLYLLHGVGGNRYEWLYGSGQEGGNFVILNIFDHLIANGEMQPLIVVFPEGRSSHDWENTAFNSHQTNILGFYYFDYELRYDLIPFIESNYNTFANIEDTSVEAIKYNRNHRAIAGLSMGGMQALNLTFGGYRFDSTKYTKSVNNFGNGLDQTCKTPGMQDLFAYVGAFSNAPTSSDGLTLGRGIASSEYKINLLYITCGDADGIAMHSYRTAISGLKETAGDNLNSYYQVVMKGNGHDFSVWNNGVYNFARLCFGKNENSETDMVKITLD